MEGKGRLMGGFGFGSLGKKNPSPAWGGRRYHLTRGVHRSAKHGEGRRDSSLRAIARPAAEVGPDGERRARAEMEDGPLGSEGKRAAGEKNWASGPKARKINIFVFFFLFNYFKVFSNDFET
jgi:hypothetical protein